MNRIDRHHVLVCIALILTAVCLGLGCKKAADEASTETQPAVITTETGEMVLVPAGSFIMGSDKGEPDERPKRTVRMDAARASVREVWKPVS